MARSVAEQGSPANLALAAVGIVGGAVLLAAFVIDIPSDLNTLRLMLFNVGAIAIVVGVHRRQGAADPRLALLGAAPALVANAWYLAMTILAMGRPQPFAGDFGFVYFLAAIAMWLTDAVFGLVTLRLGMVSRWGAIVLAIGSALAVTGIDRLGLSSTDDPTVFGPLALVGAALNGIGWILLGLDLAIRSRSSR